MGYTHYWQHTTIAPDDWQALVTDAQLLINEAGIALAGGDGTGEPEFSDKIITFNGRAAQDEDYETFELSSDEETFAFCKTDRRPYDLIVCAILLRAANILPNFTVSSDGSWDAWAPARELYARVFDAQMPEKPAGLR